MQNLLIWCLSSDDPNMKDYGFYCKMPPTGCASNKDFHVSAWWKHIKQSKNDVSFEEKKAWEVSNFFQFRMTFSAASMFDQDFVFSLSLIRSSALNDSFLPYMTSDCKDKPYSPFSSLVIWTRATQTDTISNMSARKVFMWLGGRIRDYNVFIPDEDETIGDNNQTIDPVLIIEHQRYATRLYIPLLIGKVWKGWEKLILIFLICSWEIIFYSDISPLLLVSLYIFVFVANMDPKTETVTVSPLSTASLDQLRSEHGGTLRCPCSRTSIPYRTFISNTISLHPVCSSMFVRREWIEALYVSNPSAFLVPDFRATAHAQVVLYFFSH